MEKIVIGLADNLDPEGHDLHEAARARRRHGIFLEAAFHLDQPEHKLWIQPGARCFVMHGA